MINRMTGRKLIVMTVCLLSWATAPSPTFAQDEPDFKHDARLEGYTDKLALEPSNTAMTWVGFAVCSGIALLALFKDAKRSHLD